MTRDGIVFLSPMLTAQRSFDSPIPPPGPDPAPGETVIELVASGLVVRFRASDLGVTIEVVNPHDSKIYSLELQGTS